MSSGLLQVIQVSVGRVVGVQVPVTDSVGRSAPSPAPAAQGDTWGISGPDFVRLFAILLAVTALAAWILRWRTDRRRDPAVRSAADLTPTELAYVANGPDLVAVTVLWSLWRSGAIAVDNALIEALEAEAPSGLDAEALMSPQFATASAATTVSIGPWPRDACDDIEAEVLGSVRAAGVVRPAALSRSLREGDAMRSLEASLEQRGLLRSSTVRRRMQVAVVLAFLPLLLLGAVRVLVGGSRGKPVSNLVGLLVLAVVVLGGELIVRQLPRSTVRLADRAHRQHARRTLEVTASLAAPAPLLDEPRALAALGAGVLWRAHPVGAATLAAPWSMVVARRHLSQASAPTGGAAFVGGGGGCGGGGGGGGGCGGGGCGG